VLEWRSDGVVLKTGMMEDWNNGDKMVGRIWSDAVVYGRGVVALFAVSWR
jgi:hypothetical protein